MKKLTNVKTLREKDLTMDFFFFFEIHNYAMEWCHQKKNNKERTETLARRCSMKKVFLEILQNLRQSDCARLPPACNFIKKEALPQLLSCEFCKISKNTFYYRTPPVAASVKKERKFFKLAFKLKLTSV